MDPSLLTTSQVASDRDGTEGIRVTMRSNDKLGLSSVYVDYNYAGNKDEGIKPDSNMMVLPVWVRHAQKYDDGGDNADSVSAAPMVAAGLNHSLALDSMGQVWAWGDNSYGQLGISNDVLENGVSSLTYPKRILENLTYTDTTGVVRPLSFTYVAAGDNFSLAVDNLGRVWSWGDNAFHQLGRGNDTTVEGSSYRPGMVITNMTGVTTLLGTVTEVKEYERELADGSIEITAITVQDRIVAVAAGTNHAVALSASGIVYAWGDNTYGQLGYNDRHTTVSKVARQMTKGASPSSSSYVEEVVSITAGADFTAVMTSNGTVYSVGRNDKGQMGDTYETNRLSFIKVLEGEKRNEYDPDNHYFDKAVDIRAGANHIVALRVDGSIYAWGEGGLGQIGQMPEPSKPEVPEAPGEGEEEPGEDQKPEEPVEIPAFVNYPKLMVAQGGQQIGAGFNATFTKVYDSNMPSYTPERDRVKVLAWGDNSLGQLGNYGPGSEEYPVPNGTPVDRDNTVPRAVDHSVVITDDGSYSYMQLSLIHI